jgi:hypothetical protein
MKMKAYKESMDNTNADGKTPSTNCSSFNFSSSIVDLGIFFV